jgi:hypothetical protein
VNGKCVAKTHCLNTKYGCCEDDITTASDSAKTNCPNRCECHPAGSYSQLCDTTTGQCSCRQGVVGKHCDTCSFGYWGIKKILDSQQSGCLCKYFILISI